MNDDRNRRVRDRAYALWEREGRPHGRHEEHWRQAEQEAGDDEAAPGYGQVATDGSPMAQPGAPGTGGLGTDAGSASAGSGSGVGGMMGGGQAGHAGAAAPGGAKALRADQQEGSAASPGPRGA